LSRCIVCRSEKIKTTIDFRPLHAIRNHQSNSLIPKPPVAPEITVDHDEFRAWTSLDANVVVA
jgi:hypothetical protein